MTVVVGMTDLLMLGPMEGEQKQFLQSVKHATDALLRILDEAVDFSRLEAGVLELGQAEFSLAEVVRQAQETLAEGSAPLRLSVTIDDRVPPRLVGDGDRWRQMIEALTRSAAKFRSGGDYDLRIAAKPAGSGMVRLHLALGDRQKPFDAIAPVRPKGGRVFTLKDFARHGYKGAGMGLPVAAGVAGLMGGRLWMADDASSPALFRVTAQFGLPERQRGGDLLAAIEAELDAGPTEVDSMHVLLVEDTPANRRFFTSVLEQRGHTVEAAANGSEALQVVQSRGIDRAFDLILIDLEMPVMDGRELAAAVRKLDSFATCPIPLVALTAHQVAGDADLVGSELFDAAITKPCELAQFYAVLEALPKRRSKERASVERDATPAERVDHRGTLDRLGGNERLFYDLARFVLEDAPVVLAELETALGGNEAKRAERAAHSLKGLVANFGAKEATRLAAELQRLGHDGELNGAAHIYQRLATEVNLLRRELEEYQARAAHL